MDASGYAEGREVPQVRHGRRFLEEAADVVTFVTSVAWVCGMADTPVQRRAFRCEGRGATQTLGTQGVSHAEQVESVTPGRRRRGGARGGTRYGGGGAAAAEDEAVVICQTGYVCLQPLLGTQPVLVKEGERATFNPALQVTEVTNMTRVTYCVTGGLSYGLPPGGTQTWDSSVNTVGPRPGPGACLA